MDRETKRENFTFAEVEENEHEVEKLNIWLERIEKKDYFRCAVKSEVLKRLEGCSSLLNQFSKKVFELDDEK